MKKFIIAAFTALTLLVSAAPSYADCVMPMESYRGALASLTNEVHRYEGTRLQAAVQYFRELSGGRFALEDDTTALEIVVFPDRGVGFYVELSSACVTFQPQQGPIAQVRQAIQQIDRVIAEKEGEKH